MSWNVRIATEVKQDISKLPSTIASEAVTIIEELREEPFPDGCLRMRGIMTRTGSGLEANVTESFTRLIAIGGA